MECLGRAVDDGSKVVVNAFMRTMYSIGRVAERVARAVFTSLCLPSAAQVNTCS